jgi:amidase
MESKLKFKTEILTSRLSEPKLQYYMATNGSSPPGLSLFSSLLLIPLAILSSGSHIITSYGFSIREATIGDLQLAFEQNQLTSRQLVEFYIREIRRLNSVLNGVIEVNPDALYQADKADHERKAKAYTPGSLSGLHGIPILL